jgi:hypothetical protein
MTRSGGGARKKIKKSQIKRIILKKLKFQLFYITMGLEKFSLREPGSLSTPASATVHESKHQIHCKN